MGLHEYLLYSLIQAKKQMLLFDLLFLLNHEIAHFYMEAYNLNYLEFQGLDHQNSKTLLIKVH